jgi:hypothetical protein
MAFGHPLDSIWGMTPRQAAAWATLGMARTRSEMAVQLMIARLAEHGKDETVQKQLRDWEA